MLSIEGERLFGKVDRVPGACYVATMFAHVHFLPLIPIRSYIVLEGTESSKEFRGKPISLNLKSVFVAYADAWAGALALGTGLLAGMMLVGAIPAPGKLAVALVLVAAACGITALSVRGKLRAAFQHGAHLLSTSIWIVFHQAAEPDVGTFEIAGGGLIALVAANVALFFHGLTRRRDRASTERACELLDELDIRRRSSDDPPPSPELGEGWEYCDGSEPTSKPKS